MSDFNAADFLNETIDAPLETELKLVPEGEYSAMIDDFPNEAVERIDFEYKKGPLAGQPGSMLKLNLPFVINDDRLVRSIGRDTIRVYKQMILDIDPTTKKLDFGVNKNLELGQIRDAVGQNVSGQQWGIGRLRASGPIMVKVVHTNYDRKDGTKGKRAEISRVLPIR